MWEGAHWAAAKMLCGLIDASLGGSHWLCLSCVVQMSLTHTYAFPTLCFVSWKVAEDPSGCETGLYGAISETTFPSR